MSELKRYLVFSGFYYEGCDDMCGYCAGYDTIEEAIYCGEAIRYAEWIRVLDMETEQVAFEFLEGTNP